jgi:hypothetical protein
MESPPHLALQLHFVVAPAFAVISTITTNRHFD